MNKRSQFLSPLVIAFLLLIAGELYAKENHKCVISKTGIGQIKLGMLLSEAKKAFPESVFQRSTDGEGAALVDVLVGKENIMTLHADEENAESPINWMKKIDYIETFHFACQTASGVYPGMPVKDVEKILGKTKEIIQTEIESREFIDFQNQPKNFLFRLDYTGIYPEGSHRTTEFAPSAKIFSIAVITK